MFAFSGKIREAEEILTKLRGNDDIRKELDAIVLTCQQNENHG